jgi:hypothetical protein
MTVVAILGMHRSGTSWLTGSLQEAGLELGEVNTQARHNAKGNRESEYLQQLHESVLEANGGSWRDPRWPNSWSWTKRRKLARYIKRMNADYPRWGFKDPRSLMVFDQWLREVPDIQRIGIFRHPLAVFRSLHARNADFTQDEAVGLWRTYNERLIDEHNRAPFPVVRFDVSRSELDKQLATVCDALGLEAERAAFFEENLVHNEAPEPIPDEAADVWKTLEELAIG